MAKSKAKPAPAPSIVPDEGIIQFQFVLGTGFSSRLISYRSGGPSHVDFVMPAGYGYAPGSLLGARSDTLTPLGYAIAIPAGVQVRPANYEKWKQTWVLTKHVSKAQERAVYGFALEQVGKPYDVEGILSFITGRYPHSDNWRDPSAWFCDELGVRALEVGKVIPELPLTPNRIDPGGLLIAAGSAGFTA